MFVKSETSVLAPTLTAVTNTSLPVKRVSNSVRSTVPSRLASMSMLNLTSVAGTAHSPHVLIPKNTSFLAALSPAPT